MFGVTTSDDYRPVAWMGRYPVDVTTMLVGIHVAAAILAAILVTVGAGSVLVWLQFDSAAIWSSGQVWRLFTYAFVHAPSGLLWFAVEMYLLFVFGREVERFLGRRAYIALYALLLITPAALLTIWGLWERCAIAGSPELHFGIFIAFATISPRAELLLRIMAKWVALILAGVYTFQLLAYHAWSDLMVLWTSIGVAFLFVELNGAGPELAWWNAVKERFTPKPKFHVLPKPRTRTGVTRSESEDVYTSIDAILAKISKFGIGSITANERRQLERYRERLLKDSE
ncbi:MAG TPA: rhomboid family intramembrane serine protease [Candidatus Babeliales bacterium]|jgi:membrane associated rhomboid family serine protease|nr:rhomboid family intramembrane serine protease [Candidatus Babeliales bacterium]